MKAGPLEERLGLHFEGKWQPSLDLEGSTPQHLHFSEPCWSETGGARSPTVTAEGQGVRVVLQKMEGLGAGTSALQVGASRCRQSPAAVIDQGKMAGDSDWGLRDLMPMAPGLLLREGKGGVLGGRGWR